MANYEDLFPDGYVPDIGGGRVEAQRLFFDRETIDSPLAGWAHIREQDYGEEISPSHVYIVSKNDKPHTVAWLNRSGMDFISGDAYAFHHVACDCMPEAEIEGSMEGMLSCEALNTAIMRRAQEVRAEYCLSAILPAEPQEKMGTNGEQIVISTMLYILERDQYHPEAWLANYMSGRHELPLLSLILRRDVDELAIYASMLKEAGKLEVDNDYTVRLVEDEPVD